jgi:hypothetical protein
MLPFKCRKLFFKFKMNIGSARGAPGSREINTILSDRFNNCLFYDRMTGEAKVIIAPEVRVFFTAAKDIVTDTVVEYDHESGLRL